MPRSNGTRGWFPSNYVKVIASNREQDSDEELIDGPIKRNNEYRLSLSYNNVSDYQQNDNSWLTPQKMDDGSNVYLYNPLAGNMKGNKMSESTINMDSEYESDQISTIDMPSWSDQSTLLSIDEKVKIQFIYFNIRIINPSKNYSLNG